MKTTTTTNKLCGKERINKKKTTKNNWNYIHSLWIELGNMKIQKKKEKKTTIQRRKSETLCKQNYYGLRQWCAAAAAVAAGASKQWVI